MSIFFIMLVYLYFIMLYNLITHARSLKDHDFLCLSLVDLSVSLLLLMNFPVNKDLMEFIQMISSPTMD